MDICPSRPRRARRHARPRPLADYEPCPRTAEPSSKARPFLVPVTRSARGPGGVACTRRTRRRLGEPVMAQRRTRFPLDATVLPNPWRTAEAQRRAGSRGLDGGTAGGCRRAGREVRRRCRSLSRRRAHRQSVDGRRGHEPASRGARVLRLDRDAAADRSPAPARRRRVRLPRDRGRGCDRRPPAAKARALRRHAVRRPSSGHLPGQGGGGRVRRDPHLRRTELRAHGPPQPDARPGSRPGTDGERSGAARARSGGGPLRDPRRRRRRLCPGRRGPPEGHRRDRGPGVPQRSQGVPAHLRAVRRGHRVPALDATVDGDARRARRPASTSTVPTRSSSATCATSPTTRRRSSSASTTSA